MALSLDDGWSKLDKDLREKWDQLKSKETLLQLELKKLRKFQEYINNLKMTQTSDPEKYDLPNDYSGNKMSKSQRTKQISDLAKNIDTFLKL